ncbi:MAG TPA: RelA/SpoT domain-containing protein [Solirubrobacterales bacterium]|jgi:ppGpp synthetase/RelA/SpoT-type nucleotidyltranferase|nr:RelA/SpoT domain-containing protein [Solirubrobacterales bacterium]
MSRTQVDRAGAFVRRWWGLDPGSEEDEAVDDDELLRAVDIIDEYRSSFQGPLKKTTVGLRQFVQRESETVVVGQRLKRRPQILNKLERFSSMRLTQMEDIAGCRAILAGGAPQVAGVLRRIRRNWDIVGIDDYVKSPKSTGYRAIHVVIRRDGHVVEIQLRTPGQHDWAEAVERVAARIRKPLKDGVGPPDLLTYFELVAWVIASEENGESIEPHLLEVLRRFQVRMEPYFTASLP